MIEIRLIDEEHARDINIPNEPFPLFGRMIPSYTQERWRYDIVYFEKEDVSQMCFPDEGYSFEAMRSDHVFVGAYDGDRCVGLAILRDSWNRYMYLYDLKTAKDYRRQEVGSALIEKAKAVGRERGYRGLYTQGQDNNLSACTFYIKAGFHIGGFDSNVYKGTAQEGKADILFYMDF